MDMKNLVPSDLKNFALFMEDFNEDGVYDTVIDVKENEKKLPCEIHFDFNGDEIADYIVHLEYYDDDRLFKKAIDKGADGTIDMIETYAYDKEGNRTIVYDDNADENPDFVKKISAEGNAQVYDVRSKGEKFKSALDEIILNDFKAIGAKLKKVVVNVKEKLEDQNKQL